MSITPENEIPLHIYEQYLYFRINPEEKQHTLTFTHFLTSYDKNSYLKQGQTPLEMIIFAA